MRARSHQACLQNTQDLVKICQELGWLVNLEKSELEPKQVFDFVVDQFNLRSGWVRPTPEAEPPGQNTETAIPTGLSGLAAYFLERFTNSHRKASLPRPAAYETHTVTSQKQLEGTGITRKVIPIPRSLHPHLQWWLKEDNVLTGQPLHPIKHALQIFTDTSKEGWGRSLLRAHCKRNLVSSGKQSAYKLAGTKRSLSSLKKVPRPLLRQDNTCSTDNTTVVSYINKEGGMRSGSLCALLWRILTWCIRKQVTQSSTHSRPAEHGSRQAIQAKPDHPNRVVSPSRGLPNNMMQVSPAKNRPICHEVQQQVTSVCVTNTGSPGHSSGCTRSAMGGSGRIRLPTSSHIGQSGGENAGLPMHENHSDCSGVPNMPWFWDQMAMSSQIPLSLPIMPNLLTQPFNQIPHRILTI